MYKYFWSMKPVTVCGVLYPALTPVPIKKSMVNEVQALADAGKVTLTLSNTVSYERPEKKLEARKEALNTKYKRTSSKPAPSAEEKEVEL